jgi:hypothetical protein
MEVEIEMRNRTDDRIRIEDLTMKLGRYEFQPVSYSSTPEIIRKDRLMIFCGKRLKTNLLV